MAKLIILVKICYKLLYVIQGIKYINFLIILAPADIKVFGHTYIPVVMLLLIGLVFFTPMVVILFSISLYILYKSIGKLQKQYSYVHSPTMLQLWTLPHCYTYLCMEEYTNDGGHWCNQSCGTLFVPTHNKPSIWR